MYLLLVLCASWCASALTDTALFFDIDNAAQHFKDFICKFEKEYENEEEKHMRFRIFVENLKLVNKLNEESDHAVFGITKFMDLLPEEIAEMYTGHRDYINFFSFCDTILTDDDIPDVKAPEAFDWRQKNAVTRVGDQGSCSSCYAFSAVGNLEGQHAIKHKELVELSKQQIIDCDKTCFGCRGGFASVVFIALKDKEGLIKEEDYPYERKNGKCRYDAKKVVVKVKDCVSYNLTSQEKVKQLLYMTGPLSIAVKSRGMSMYTGGILSDKQCASGQLNHEVLLVGYGEENNKPYWIIKNSWGAKLGEHGYYRVERSNNKDGACGMVNYYMTSAIIE